MTDGYKIKRVLVWQNGVEKQIYPAGWQPGANTYIYYPLTSNLVDQMGNGNTGTMTGNCTFDSNTGIHVTGKSGNYVTGLSNGIANRNIFTNNVWVKVSNGDQGVIVGYATPYQNTQCYNIYKWGTLGVFCIVNGGNQTDTSTDISGDNNWHNYAISANGTKYSMYIDGVKLKEFYSSAYVQNVPEMQLGWGGVYGSGRALDGYIKDYIVETVARTDQEISSYFNQTKGNYGL